jgi:hypothetical protein
MLASVLGRPNVTCSEGMESIGAALLLVVHLWPVGATG